MTPWYKEPWPWILMAPPATAVLAGIATVWIAVASADGLVAEDYYKQGLAMENTGMTPLGTIAGVTKRTDLRTGLTTLAKTFRMTASLRLK
jgi:hypothetical protein